MEEKTDGFTGCAGRTEHAVGTSGL
jgi:hypothetical protein